ncbi:MAG: hypothetical protein HGB34_01290 [Candidatus Moranbacteria bacterium]|nr:hypothetical protein [Candidatus Moranbacteria bacterium]
MKLELIPLMKTLFIDSRLLVWVAVLLLVIILKGLFIRSYRKWKSGPKS